jgi:ribosomal protein S18 acetylase RimI-like enzyme
VLVKGLGVSETHRGAGVGRQLLSQLEENAAAIGAVEVHLGTVSAARGFYTRLGYTGRSRMHKPLSGMGIARYGAAEERRQRLQSMRGRRTNRLTHQGAQSDRD